MKRMLRPLIGTATPIVGMFAWAYAHYVFGMALYRPLYWPLTIALVIIGAVIIYSEPGRWRVKLLILLIWIPTMIVAAVTATLIVGCRFEACL